MATPQSALVNVQRVYDSLAAVYPASSNLFHSTAHQHALAHSGIVDGMRVLEVATGSGEMFRRIAEVNPHGVTVGLDLSPKMAARTQSDTRELFPGGSYHCQAADARYLPFQCESFDAIVCCYLLELVGENDIDLTLRDFHRLLRPGGRVVMTLIGQNSTAFNFVYKICGGLVPAFWGRQLEERVAMALPRIGFEIRHDERVRQLFYPSRVIVAIRSESPAQQP